MRSGVAVQGFPALGHGVAARSGWLRPRIAVLLAGVIVAVGCVAVLRMLPSETSGPVATAHGSTGHGLESLPLAAQGPVSASLGQDAPAYRLEGLRAANPEQHLHARFSRRGVVVASGTAHLGMSLSAYGHGSTLRPVGSAVPRASANRVHYARGALTEWYANGPLGIEQGFDVAARPGPAAGPLTLSLALSGNLAARPRGGSVLFTGGGAALRYGGLVATDAHGQVLRSWLEVVKGQVLIRVADRGAAYPLRIDPMIQQGKKLTGAGAVGSGRFGYAVALSADGDTALIGARYGIAGGETGIGAGGAWVFVRSGGTWAQQGGKLVGTGHAGEGEFAHVGEGEFGTSVALSGDGDTALIGAPADDGYVGAAWAFTRSGSTWAQQGEKLTGAGETGEGRFGKSVTLSADGDTALIGGTHDDGNVGAAWAFTRSGSTWTQQGGKLTGTDEAGPGEFGRSVALSADGGTALIGGWGDNGNEGAAWAFTRSGSTWTQQGEKLTGELGGEGEFGTSVALSGDGDTALIGGPGDDDDVGAAWAFTRSGGTWAEQGPKLTGTGEAGEGRFGVSVALSVDGDTALVGGPSDDSDVGAAWAFTRSGSTWTQQGEKLVGSGESGAGEFGSSVALAANGDTALIGVPEDAAAIGGTWAFTRSGGVWSQQGSKLTGGEEDNSEFGVLVALSADGNTALVGGWNDDGRKGAAWVFTRSGGVWSQQGPKLTAGSESESGAGLGTSVALSADGNTALIGAPGNEFRKGAAWIFTRSGTTWTQQGGKLTGTGAVNNAWFGYTVALSGDGKTALIGGWLDDGWKGAAWVFTRSGSTWAQQGPKLTPDDEDGEGMFGTNVTLSADGNTALIGGWNDDSELLGGNRDYSGKGAAWVFTRSGSTWTQQGPKLTPDDEAGNGKFGTIVALSASGDTALIGGWNDDHSKGAAWVFTRSGSTWAQQGPKLTGSGETGEGRFGVAVALSADGDTALVGGLADDSTRGAAWMFTRSGSTWAQGGPKIAPSDWAGEGEFGTNVALSADGATGLIGAWRDNSGTGAAWAFVNPYEATTAAATNVGESGATLNGALAGASGKAYFEYGTTATYGASTSAQGVGVSGSPSPLAAAIGGLAPGTTYHYRLVAENSAGAVHGNDQTFTTGAHGEPAKPPCCGPDPEKPPHVLLVQDVRQSTARWRRGSRLATVSRARTPIGTTFSFSLNDQATVTFSFTRRAGGRTVTAGTLTFTGHAGTNKVAFQGRVSPRKKLKLGRYTLVVTATDPAGARSAPKSLSFTIVR